MAQNQGNITEKIMEDKLKEESSSSNDDMDVQVSKQQSNDIMGILQQLLTKQDQLLDENTQLKTQVAFQQITINNLTQVVEELKISPPPHHQSTANLSVDVSGIGTVTSSMTKTQHEKPNLHQHAAKQLQSKRIDQLLNSTPFSGTTSQEVSDWLEEFNLKCDKLEFDDTQRLSIAIDLLKSNAKLWYDTNKGAIEDWTTFTDKLMSHFKLVTGTDQFQLEQKLYNRRRQHYESATDYCHSVLKLCSKVNKEMGEAKRIKHLTQGLNPNAQLHMDLKHPNTTEEFLEALLKFDKWQMEEQKQQQYHATFDQQRQYNWTQSSYQTHDLSKPQQKDRGNPPSDDQKQQHNNGKEYTGCWSCGAMDHYQYQCSKNY
ncbi:unnamed protein product [Adineta ricciae]|uniref:Gag protein n=1 Tax=Adineta ricciae TaxID=249248 RepID=A0A815VHN6_ADIRI|nr:unnamed protein product [Adineta ricciae]CAF1528397.1 unnamed protein product [Adineta ricciae]